MELLQTPQHAKAWTCPECGHGSPEPRDQQAHLDAHRQLKQFFREWDAAAAAEQRAEHRGRRTLLLGSAGLLVAILLAVALLVRLSGGDGAVAPRAALPAPSPRADLPSTTTPPPRAQPPAVTPNRPGPSTDAATGRTASVPARPTATSTTGPPGIAPPLAASAPATPTAALPPVATIPTPPSPARETGLAVHGCVLVVCLAIGP